MLYSSPAQLFLAGRFIHDCQYDYVPAVLSRDVTKFAFEFENVRTSTFTDSKFVKFFHVPVVEFEPQVYTIGTGITN